MAVHRNCPDCGEPLQAPSGARVRCCECSRAWSDKIAPAQRAATKAMKLGQLVRQPCEICGDTAVQAHHDDYSKPLDVRWLCRSHHVGLHKAQARLIRAFVEQRQS